jgi:hypothetical protein
MNENWKDLLPQDFAADSRVWIYQASRRFAIPEALHIESLLEDFVPNWKSHGAPVAGYANLFFGQFVVLIADESRVPVGGCSTDSSVRVIRVIEAQTGVHMFDRTTLAFLKDDKIEMLPMNQLAYAAQHGFISPNTLYFNNTVLTLAQLKDEWLVPAGKTWLKNRFFQTA